MTPSPSTVAVIGAGPAGLMAAERLAQAGRRVVVHERMPSVARKFLMAGRGGLNLTHSEPLDPFLNRYDAAAQARINSFTRSKVSLGTVAAWARCSRRSSTGMASPVLAQCTMRA